MNPRLRTFGVLCGAAASFFCLLAGIWLLSAEGFQHGDDAMSTALGFYFIGKGLFVGPALILAAHSGSPGRGGS